MAPTPPQCFLYPLVDTCGSLSGKCIDFHSLPVARLLLRAACKTTPRHWGGKRKRLRAGQVPLHYTHKSVTARGPLLLGVNLAFLLREVKLQLGLHQGVARRAATLHCELCSPVNVSRQ